MSMARETIRMSPDPLPEWLRKAPRYCPEPLKAAQHLCELINSSSDEAERIGQVPEPVVRAVSAAGLYAMMIPKQFGGAEPHPVEVLDAISEMSYADGSIGWSVMANVFFTGSVYTRGPDALLEAVFNSDAGYIGAGQISTLGRADRRNGGCLVSGSFHFGSGSREASWFMGAVVEHIDGKPRLNEFGAPTIQLVWRPRDKVIIKPNWDVMGLVATSSNDFDFPEQFVSDDFIAPLSSRPMRGDAMAYITVTLGHAAWALGVARRTMDELRSLAEGKKRFGRQTVIDNPIFQRDFGLHTAMLNATIDNCRAVFARVYDQASKGIDDLHIRAEYRLAACWAVEVALKISDFAWLSAGSDALRNRDGQNRLQRCYRDIHAGTQHRHTDHHTIQDCGTVLLGVEKPNLAL